MSTKPGEYAVPSLLIADIRPFESLAKGMPVKGVDGCVCVNVMALL